jgi:hypothetical protein
MPGSGTFGSGAAMTIPAKVAVMKVSRKRAECLTNSRTLGLAVCRRVRKSREGTNEGIVSTDSDIGSNHERRSMAFEIRGQSVALSPRLWPQKSITDIYSDP